MNTVEILRKTRDRQPLTALEIQHLIHGAVTHTIPDYQLSAWLMAVCIRGLSLDELAALVHAMRFSGETFDASSLGRFVVDKHSTGGVGDKTSFLVAPICAAAGLVVPMIGGRALGHTGGTLDKLDSIAGFRTRLSPQQMLAALERVGCIIVGQSEQLVPADRILYALRDVTATTESPYLLCSSIMSKKLAEGLNGLVLDVKTGSGAFLPNEEDASFLAALMVKTGEAAGTRTVAVVTSMDQPLGAYAGNLCEIFEAFTLLRNKPLARTEDTLALSLHLAGWMLHLGNKAPTPEAGRALAEELLTTGAAYEAFRGMVSAQGGDPDLFPSPKFHHPGPFQILRAERDGYIHTMHTRHIGLALQHLGAGRQRAEDTVSPNAGIMFLKKIGEPVQARESIAALFADDQQRADDALLLLRSAIEISDQRPQPDVLIRRTITIENADDYIRAHLR